MVVCAFASARLEQTVACVESVLQSGAPSGPGRDRGRPQRCPRGRSPSPPSRDGGDRRQPRHARGLSSARNTAIARSRGDYIVFIDDDAIAHEEWLARLLSAFDDPAVIGAGGHARPLWASPPPAWFPPEFLWVVGCSYAGLPETGLGAQPAWLQHGISRRRVPTRGHVQPRDRASRQPAPRLRGDRVLPARIAAQCCPVARIALVDGAEIDHHVPAARATVSYLLRRCYFEGISKALVRRLGDQRSLDTERTYLRQALPARVKASVRRALGGHVAEGLGLSSAPGRIGGLPRRRATSSAGRLPRAPAGGRHAAARRAVRQRPPRRRLRTARRDRLSAGRQPVVDRVVRS